MNHSEIRKFLKSLFFQEFRFGLRKKKKFCSFWLFFLPIESGSVDPHIFADPDPISQNLADPTDPDSKHCYYYYQSTYSLSIMSCKQRLIQDVILPTCLSHCGQLQSLESGFSCLILIWFTRLDLFIVEQLQRSQLNGLFHP